MKISVWGIDYIISVLEKILIIYIRDLIIDTFIKKNKFVILNSNINLLTNKINADKTLF